MPFEIIGATFISYKSLNMENPRPILLKDLGMMYPTPTSKQRKRYGIYKCHCGKEFKTQTLKNKCRVYSCGCNNNVGSRTKTHGLSKHRIYNVWKDMMSRCYNKNCKSYQRYGAIGVTVSKEWHNVKTFIDDMYPTFKEGLSLDKDKICIEKNITPTIYSKETCRWATTKEQSRVTKRIHKNNVSGYRGVSYSNKDKTYFASITINSKNKYIGASKDKLVCAKMYDNYIKENNLEHTTNF